VKPPVGAGDPLVPLETTPGESHSTLYSQFAQIRLYKQSYSLNTSQNTAGHLPPVVLSFQAPRVLLADLHGHGHGFPTADTSTRDATLQAALAQGVHEGHHDARAAAACKAHTQRHMDETETNTVRQ
jgi:hypothetical protein